MPDASPDLAATAPIIPTKDLLFEVRLFKTHYLLANYDRGKIEDETWVCIGGDYIRLPDHYGATLLDNDGLAAGRDPSEEFRHPRLYAPSTEWVSYIPDAISWYLDHPDDDILWPFQYFTEGSALLETDDGTVKIPGRLISEIARDVKEAREVGIDRAGCGNAKETKRAGAISWGLGHVDEWTKGLLTRTRGVSLRRWLILDAPKLGFVLDPRDSELDSYPLLDARQGGCPIYYPWSYRWRPEQSNAELEALAGVDVRNFAMVIEKNWASPSPLLSSVRTGPPLFPGTILASRISSEEPEDPAEETLDREAYERREMRLRDLQEKAEKALGQEFTHHRPVYIIWSYADERNLPRDATIILSPVNEVRMRLWGLWMRTSSPAQIVFEAIARGMAVQLVYRLDTDTAEKAMRDHEPYTPPLPPRVLAGSFSGYWETWDEFVTLAKFILSLPDAGAYLMLGGITARIAVWLGPPDLISRFAKGPSTYASLQTTELDPERNYLADSADPERVRALCGVVEDPVDGTIRTWFPTQENIEYCGFWRGEWTDAHELWFLTRIGNIYDRSDSARPMTSHQWSGQLKRRKVRWFDKHEPEAEELEKLVVEFALETGGSWRGASLKDMESRFGYD
ncbi:hypothetical protein BC629DRAFT_1436759 [Irpex lacteus]|nr:hypothetical protein BC629DRAFT_1436759 [Irpex lacteus]